jgi:hypothetical protein
MSTADVTLTELLESVTGFDEIAVEQQFGIDLYVGNDAHPMKVARAAVFIHKIHQQTPAPEARKYALGLTTNEVESYFLPEPEEPVAHEPVTDVGKDEPAPMLEPTSSPDSASPPEYSPPRLEL